ncbi:hypothetical protein [Kitasatospora acidiphila]|uniref:hypothetical protein n=1 Tax=Kitasatospora acidiphila TaxID=2567942 RepID=UPI001E4CD82C|nr:hypothetical protein [Kitasatospora acidiphila]
MAFTEKLLQAPAPIQVGGYRLKRYHVTADPGGIDPAVEKAAYAALPDLLPAPTAPRRPASWWSTAATTPAPTSMCTAGLGTMC